MARRPPIPRDVRKLIKEVYGNRCAVCGHSKHLHLHHIDHNKFNNDLDNLILLCRSCHAEEHPENYHKIIEFEATHYGQRY